MEKINYNKMTEMIKRNVIEAQRCTLLELRNDILNRVNDRATVMYSETAEEIRSHMKLPRMEKTYRARLGLFKKNHEDFQVIGLIGKKVEELTKELMELTY